MFKRINFLLTFLLVFTLPLNSFATNYCNDASIENCYLLDDATDPPQDSSANARHLTKVGTPVFTSGESPYSTGGSWFFDSSSSEYFHWDGNVVSNYPYTIVSWSKGTTTNQSPASLAKNNSTAYYLAILGNSTDDSLALYQRWSSGSFTTDGTDNTATSNTWNHSCGIGTSSTDREFVLNGVSDSTDTASRNFFTANDQSFAIGAIKRSTASNFFDGYITEVAFFSRALSVSECQDIYLFGLDGTKGLAGVSTYKPLMIIY